MVSFLTRRRLNIQCCFKPQTDKMCPSLSFECDICLQVKFLPVKLNNCSHYYCHPCIYRWAKSQLAADSKLDLPTCPTCRQEFDVAQTLYPVGGKTAHRFNSFLGKNIPKGLGKMALAQIGFYYVTTFYKDFHEDVFHFHLVRCHYCQEEWNLSNISTVADLQGKHSRGRPWCPFGAVISVD